MSAGFFLMSGGALLVGAAAYSYSTTGAIAWAQEPERTPGDQKVYGQIRSKHDAQRTAFMNVSPGLDGDGSPLTVTPDLLERQRRQLRMGGTILPRRSETSNRARNN